jgi:hypothetical protein
MNRNLLLVLLTLFLSFCLISCEKTEEEVRVERNLGFESFGPTDSIPKKFGKFMGATSDLPHQAMLWFEQPDGTITGFRVNFTTGAMLPVVLNIPRR